MDALASIHHVPASWLRNSDLAPFISAYWHRLIERRYADETARVYLCGVAHFARWASHRRLAVTDLADDDIQRFLDEHLPKCNCPQPVQRSRHQLRAALRHLLASLGNAGILTERQAPDAVEDELRRFDAHMLNARGLELAKQSVFPHCIRHTMAMHMLQAGVDISVIALWLGHESPSTTHMYLEADLGMKERALARLDPPDLKSVRFRPSDALLRFLQGL